MKAIALSPIATPPSRGLASVILLAVAVLAWRFSAISLSGATLYVDEAQYWTWAQHPDWGYFSKPPGIALLIGLSTALFGNGLLGVKALSMLCYPGAALLAWGLARRLHGETVAWWAAIIVLTLPIYAWLGLFASTDALLTVFWLAGLCCYLRATDSDRWGDWLALGAVCGLGLLSKYTMAVFIGAAFLHLVCCHRARLASPRPWIAMALALALLAPNIWWNVAHGFPTLRHTADITVHRQAGGHLRALGEFVAAQWLSFGPVFGSIAVLGLCRLRRLWDDPPARLLVCFVLPLWVVVAVQAASGGANANWAAPAFAPTAIAIAAWLVARNRQHLLVAGVAINVVLAAAAYHAPSLLAAVEAPQAARYNPYVRAIGWDDLARQLRPFVMAHPRAVLLADNRTLLAHMAYEVRDLRPQIVSWNPEGVAGDHFKLTTDLRAHIGGDALFIGEQPPAAEVGERFASSRKLASLQVRLDATTSRQLEVYLLHGFQDY